MNLKFQPRFPGRLRQCGDATVVLISTSIKYNLLDARGLGTLCNHAPDNLRGRDVSAALDFLTSFAIHRTCGGKSLTAAIVDDLRINMVERTVDAQARALWRAGNPLTDPEVNPLPMRVPR
jgi:hypothetical protein